MLTTDGPVHRLNWFFCVWVSLLRPFVRDRKPALKTGVHSMFRIYVGNLSFDTTEQGLTDLFAQHGTVSSAAVITDRFTGRSRGFGFIEMADEGEGKAAMSALDGQDFEGRALKVNEAHAREPQRDGGGGGGARE